jgi:hypothetical protein
MTPNKEKKKILFLHCCTTKHIIAIGLLFKTLMAYSRKHFESYLGS